MKEWKTHRKSGLSTMLRMVIRISLTLLVLNQLLTPCTALRSRNNGRYNTGSKDPVKPKTFAGTSSGLPSQNATRRGLGISAWGIVILVVSLILAGMGFYYFSMCYPIMCQEQKKYNKMSMPNLV